MNFFKSFLPYLDEVFKAMTPLFQNEYLAPTIVGILGGIAGGQKTPTTTTQRVEQVRPVLTPEEQALQNFVINQIYGNLGQTSPLQNLIQSYYGGGGYQPMTMGGVPGGMQLSPQITSQIPGAAGQILGQIGTTQMTPEATRQQYEQTVKANRWQQEVLPALQQIKQLWGDNPITAMPANVRKTGGRYGAIKTAGQLSEAHQTMNNIAKQLGMTPDEVKNLYTEWQTNPQAVAQRYAQPVQPAPAQLGPETVQPTTAQGVTQPTTTQGTEQYTPLGAIMQQSPEELAAQYNILRQQGMRGIEDWYSQAQREFEQRGVSGYGGYMGSPAERDIGGLLAERGRMQTNLGQQLGLSQLQAQQQLPYSQLQALEDVRRFEAQNLQAQQAPWLQAAQNIYSVPWGKTVSGTEVQPGGGIIPGAISGAYTGMGLYQDWQNWNRQRQNQPATAYGAGLATPGTTSGFQLAGTQNLWNQYYGG